MPHKQAQEKTVSAYINHHYPDTKVIYIGTTSDKLRDFISKPVEITDIRSCSEVFTADKNGFQLVHRPTSCSTWDEEHIRDIYYKDCEALLKDVVGASRVMPSNHIVRNRTWQDAKKAAEAVREQAGDLAPVPLMHPVMNAHVDQSYEGAEQTIRHHHGDEMAEEIMKKRWGVINIWRPLRPVTREPLAVCDFRSLDEQSDLVGVMSVLPTRGQHPVYGGSNPRNNTGEIERWELAYNPAHKWYYASNMQPEECLLVKCFDSLTDGTARCTPHSAFTTEQDEGPARESIEVRCIVIWD